MAIGQITLGIAAKQCFLSEAIKGLIINKGWSHTVAEKNAMTLRLWSAVMDFATEGHPTLS